MFGPLKKLPRLLQWNGRTRSSRQEEPLLKQLAHRDTLLRLVAVWLTTLMATGFAIWWGVPMRYRAGEVYPHDLRARVDFTVINHVELVNQERQRGDDAIHEKANHSDRPVFEKYPRGMLLAPRGQPIQERQLDLLREEHQAYCDSLTTNDHWSRAVSLFMILSLITGMMVMYVARFQIGLGQSLPMIVGICMLILTTLVLGTVLSQPPWNALLLPMTFTAMVLTLAYNPQFALMMMFALELALTVVLGSSVDAVLIHMCGMATAILSLRHVRTRTQLVQVASTAGLACLATTVATGLLSGQTWSLTLTDAFRCFVCSALAGFVLTGLLPLVERCFTFVTDISLLELADGSHPLLQELVRRAPGTYTHSMTVATLAEASAEAIGANPLLVRVGSYFHDIGKMLKPHYFIENQSGANRHDSLEPALSTLIIIGHVKDGMALAQRYHLPAPIVDFIASHHGTTLVEYFYREAMRLRSDFDSNASNTDLEACFRYPGPKPHTRELGIVMLADAVESTSRSLANPTPGSLRKLVHDLLMKRLLDGQFEESGLTLTELHVIEEQLCKSLIALFHARIKYPDAEPETRAA
ncbi:MAG: HDIG domain-containing protein [Planctomycetes bacterium]|nr:HDIG domain-containing protein [Planctomycetota bacterium]